MEGNADFRIIFPEHVNQTVWPVGSIVGFTNNHTVFVSLEAFGGVFEIVCVVFCIDNKSID